MRPLWAGLSRGSGRRLLPAGLILVVLSSLVPGQTLAQSPPTGGPIAAGGVTLRGDPLTRAGSLNGAGEGLGAIAVSGRTLVVGSQPGLGTSQSAGVVYVFSEPAGGWAGGADVAQLTTGGAGGGLGASVAISGNTVVALAGGPAASDPSSPGVAYVFSEPPGGWSGTVEPSARLVPSTAACGSLDRVAISGPTVVASCDVVGEGAAPPGQPVLVFSRPAGGWSGTLAQSAELIAAGGQKIRAAAAVAISGATAFAAGQGGGAHGYVYAFREPAGGWAGTIAQSARLTSTGKFGLITTAVAVSGRTLFAGDVSSSLAYPDGDGDASVFAFKQPAHDWSGTVYPSGRLAYPSSSFDAGPSLAVSGQTVAVGHADVDDPELNPYVSTIDVFRDPSDEWSGTLAPQATTTLSTPAVVQLALQDRTVFASTGAGAVVLLHDTQPSPPTASHFTLTGLTVTGRHMLMLAAGKLSLTLAKPRARLQLAVGPRAITESRALLRVATRDREAGKALHRKIIATVTDAAGDSTALTLTPG